MRILVCGGRDYNNKNEAFHWLDHAHKFRAITVIIQGGARGADSIAKEWAIYNGIEVEEYKANWNDYGKAAGFIRNTQMLTVGKPDGVIAFPGGRGTMNMVEQSKAAGIKVWVPVGGVR